MLVFEKAQPLHVHVQVAIVTNQVCRHCPPQLAQEPFALVGIIQASALGASLGFRVYILENFFYALEILQV
jgi:hypothetical protein